MPYENAPDVTAPLFPLTKDFLKEIVFADNTTVAETEDSCQYTCDDGYRLSTGICGSAGGVTPPVTPPVVGTTATASISLTATASNKKWVTPPA